MQVRTAARDLDEYTDVVALFEQMQDEGAESTRTARHRELIFTRCLALADRVARHYGGRGQDVEDLTQVARLGLVKAVNRFDPTKGSNFVAYAIPTMMGEVRRHFRDTGWCTHVPRRIKDRSATIIKATAELTQTLGQAPTAAQLAEHLDISREEVIESLLAAQAYQVDSIDAPASSGEAAPRLISETVGELDAGFELITDRESIRPVIKALPPRERTVLYLRFFESWSQSQIAEQLGISQMQVSRTLRALRDNCDRRRAANAAMSYPRASRRVEDSGWSHRTARAPRRASSSSAMTAQIHLAGLM